MMEPKNYEFNTDATLAMLLGNGFILLGNHLKMTRSLWKYKDGSTYIFAYIAIDMDRDGALEIDVRCDNGEMYIPFYNPEQRHNNQVYEEVVRKYNNILDDLVRKNILKHVKEKENG